MTRLMTASELESKSATNRAAHTRVVRNLSGETKRGLGAKTLSANGKKIGRPPGKWKPKPPSEHAEQSSLILWADFQFPLWGLDPRLLAAIPNGGARHPAVACKLKAEGVRAGFPDLLLASPNLFDIGYGLRTHGIKHGLYIELKALNGTVQDSQSSYHELLRAQGYQVNVCFGCAEAKDVIKQYLGRA